MVPEELTFETGHHAQGPDGPVGPAYKVTVGSLLHRGKPLIVAHSGTFRVLCRTLGVEEPEEQVANCRPVRFTPPAKTGREWTLEIL